MAGPRAFSGIDPVVVTLVLLEIEEVVSLIACCCAIAF
jgi:hypothetical protein